jgi:MFS family permease
VEPEIVSNKRTKAVYWGGFLLAIHYALIAYVNSSLLGQFVSNNALDILYVIGSILGITFLSLAPFFLRKYGSLNTFLFFVALEMLAIFGLGVANSKALVITLFIVYLSADAILYFCLDVNLEQETKTEGTTGGKRGAFLTVQNVAWVLSPLALTFLTTSNTFGRIYLLSGATLIPLFIIAVLYFRNIKETDIADSRIIPALRSLREGGDQARIIGVQFMLNFFYAWMMIYLPLLLSKEMDFSWGKIGMMFVIMLLPFLLFELPAGILSDKKLGEKEILTVGFLIMFLATAIIPFLTTTSFIIWALVLFGTRIGASFVEVSSETYFFKHVKEENTGLISLFRMTRPLAFVVVPLIALIVVHFFSYSVSFLFLAGFTLCGLFFIPKVDTK